MNPISRLYCAIHLILGRPIFQIRRHVAFKSRNICHLTAYLSIQKDTFVDLLQTFAGHHLFVIFPTGISDV